MHTLLYIKPSFLCLVQVAAYLVPVVEVPPWCRWLPTWCRWLPTWCQWLPTWCQWWRCLPGASGAGGYLPGASGGGASLVPVAASLVPVAAWILARIFTAGHVGGYARQLLSAAGNLASESKLQGEIDRCDYSYYQLFMCSFRVCFYGAVCMLKR